MNLLMVSSDASVAAGVQGAFHAMLGEFSRHWDRIDVLCPRVAEIKFPTVHGNVHFHPATGGRLSTPISVLARGRRLASQRAYALIVSHDYGMQLNGIGSWLLSRSTGIPYVSEIHHVEGWPIAVSWRERAMRAAAFLYLRAARRSAAAIRVVNEAESREVLARAGVPEGMRLLLPSFYIDFSVFRPAPADKRWDVAFCGRFASNKGIFTVLDAAALLRKDRPGLKVLLKGKGPLDSAVRRRVEVLGLSGNIEIIPWVPAASDTADLFRRSRLLVCASTCEGGPRVTLEAMACGVPVVTTPVGVMRDVIEDGRNGLFFRWDAEELARKAALILDDGALAESLGEAGRRSVQRFERSKIIREYAAGYHDLASRARPGAVAGSTAAALASGAG